MDIFLFFSLLLLGLLGCASCETCPPPEDIAPCRCRSWRPKGEIYIECHGGSVKEVDVAFDNLRGKTIDSVLLSDVKGDRLSPILFWNTRVRRITISDCDLRGLSDTDRRPAFFGLEDSLERLEIKKSIKGDNQLKTLNLSHLKNLDYLHLAGNNIPQVGNDWFDEGPLSLTEVSIVSCGVIELGDAAFAPLSNLQSLNLFENNLVSFKRSMLPNPAHHLDILTLGNNNVTRLSNDIFSEMPSLQIARLGGNSIRRIEEATWSSMWEQLNDLDLETNPLQCDSHMEWMFSQGRPKKLLGTCDSPLSVKGEQLLYFIEINRKLLSLTRKSSSKKELLIA